MKTIPLLFVALLSTFIAGFSQQVPRNKFISRVDLAAGVGTSFLRGGDPVSTNDVQQRHLKLSYCFGLEFVHDLSKRIGVSILSLYEKKGAVYTQDVLFFNEATQKMESGTARQEYVYTDYTLPLLANIGLGTDSKFIFSAGSFVSYLSKQVIQNRWPMGTRGAYDQTNLNRKFEGGIMLRIEYKLSLNQHISLRPMIANLYGVTDTRLVKSYGVTKSNVTYFQLALTLKQ